ncbi:SDR family NAD(P)-dependent oxidoreductase [Breznakiella homolactica]|uniref:SDR family NAD(P)-dependent oxidoreductase n=1 Tax=Breznakiella homolactica TaxID=2798577 RepID=A0A7T8BCJ4_9SPIR|nr:SDR family NAD(P)-dependent oxidoreductase [Breznakiella homolactica]QQO10338.1 SDR family NAD(P)-dependent oxidoreductase [Breznakiella homolactica]
MKKNAAERKERPFIPEPGIVLITGASSGIGEAFARYLTGCISGKETNPGLPGFDELWLVARRGERLLELADELLKSVSAGKGSAEFSIRTFTQDLVEPGAGERLEAEVEEAGKPLRILINNAGYGSYGPFSEVDLDTQLGQIDLNCRSLTELCGRLDPYLLKNSMVINTASLAAFAPLGGFAVYAATKAFVLSFSVALAAEWRSRGIRVCALCPGPVQSEFALVASGGVRKEVRHGYPAAVLVRDCLRQAARRKIISLPRFLWQIQRYAGKFAGPVASAFFSWRFMRRPHAPKA